jgi:hypothetical protein
MKFGKSKDEAMAEAPRGGGGGDYMRYLRAGDNWLHIVDEPDKWVWYWEHYNPGGYPFPCTNDMSSCPGCLSDNEKMAKASRKIAFNALSKDDKGNTYLNVWKVPKSVADTLEIRFDRQGTITNRPYLITQFKKDNGFYDYDVEGQDKEDLEYDEKYLRDPDDMLTEAYEEAWGTSSKAGGAPAKEKDVKSKIAREQKKQEPQDEISESDLRKMEFFELVDFCNKNGFKDPQGDSVDEIVNWMLEQD